MSGPERKAISDLLSLLGLSLDGLIIEEVPKLPPRPTMLPTVLSKPIDQQLILSIRAPVAKEDLLEIKRPKTSPIEPTSSTSMFFLEDPVNKNPWNLEVENHIKGKKNILWQCLPYKIYCYKKALTEVFITPLFISLNKL